MSTDAVLKFGRVGKKTVRTKDEDWGRDIVLTAKAKISPGVPPDYMKMTVSLSPGDQVRASLPAVKENLKNYLQQFLDDFDFGPVCLRDKEITLELISRTHQPVRAILRALDGGVFFDIAREIYRQNGLRSLTNEVAIKCEISDVMRETELSEIERISAARDCVSEVYQLLNTEEESRRAAWQMLDEAANAVETEGDQFHHRRRILLTLLTAILVVALFVMGYVVRSQSLMLIVLIAGLVWLLGILLVLGVCNYKADCRAYGNALHAFRTYVAKIIRLKAIFANLKNIPERNTKGVTELLANIENLDLRRLIQRHLENCESVVVNEEYMEIRDEFEMNLDIGGFRGFVGFLFGDLARDPKDTAQAIADVANRLDQYEVLVEMVRI